MRLSESLRALAVGALLFAGGCSSGEAPTPDTSAPANERERPLVVTTFYPTEYLCDRLAGPWIELRCDVPADADALFWEPSDEQLVDYQGADLIVLNGAGMETWVNQVSLPASRLLDTSASFEERFVEFEGTSHSHGGGEEHTHAGTDPHVWLDPLNVLEQARAIRERLAQLLPEQAGEVEIRFDALAKELNELHEQYAALGTGPEGEWLYASHPAYNYLVQRHGWRMVNLDLDPEAEIGADALEHLRAQLADHPGRFILWESAPIDANVTRLRDEFGLTSLTVTPFELLSAEEREAGVDVMSALRANLAAVERALGPREE